MGLFKRRNNEKTAPSTSGQSKGDFSAGVTLGEKAATVQRERAAMLAEAAKPGSGQSRQIRAGYVDGHHYSLYGEPIKQLKREGRLEEALALCMKTLDGAEQEAKAGNHEPAPGWTIEAAIVLRKLGRRDEEIAVLQRWIDAAPARYRKGSRVQERLDKLTT